MSSPEYVRSLARGLEVIRAFSQQPDPDQGPSRAAVSLTEIAERTGLSRATARRLLLTLMDVGYVAQRGRSFELTPKVLELGYAYFSSADLPQLIQPVVEGASQLLAESVSASVLDGAEIVYIARAHTRRIMRINLEVGTRLPAYATSMGRVHLAYLSDDQRQKLIPAELEPLTGHTLTDREKLFKVLDEVRQQGWCLVEHELEVGLRSAAVPVFNASGQVVAALNVALGLSSGVDSPDLAFQERFIAPLQQAAQQIFEALRHQDRS